MEKKGSSSSKGNGRRKRKDKSGFLVVGIGASAGGIQALSEFFANVKKDSGVAYVVILHLSPEHESKLAEVLQIVSGIPVSQVKEKVKIEPNRVYVVPPNKSLSMQDGHIIVKPVGSIEERRAPVDIFFRTLAESHNSRAVGVILSGTGANGSMGLKRIKEVGGAVFVQNPREAEFNEMPRNSIATELVDEILPVAEIPERIAAYRDHLGLVNIPDEPVNRPEEQQNALREIFAQLRLRTGHDFSNYKRPTMLRRIERRISIRNLTDLKSYSEYLRENPEEPQALLKDLLISVTNFFRDKKAFEYLEKEIIPRLLANRDKTKPVRIWVAGCATGEEAYSIAMIAAEKIFGQIDAPPIQIFATDIDEPAIRIAREGLYTINDAADVSPERLRRFFTKEGDQYRVRREIREIVLFANHNVLKDPPFSHLDLVSCRNLLIYLDQPAQERILETFHFALEPGGYLFIGPSESIDGAADLFVPVRKDRHIFQSRLAASRPFPVPESVPVYRVEVGSHEVAAPGQAKAARERLTFSDLHIKLLEKYAPPSLVVNQDYEIVHMSEEAGKYLKIAGGEPSKNLLELIRPEIRLELRTALFQALQQNTNVETKGLQIPIDGKTVSINILVRPVLEESDLARGFVLIIFEPAAEGERQPAETVYTAPEPIAQQLEEELIRSKSQLQLAVEQAEIQSEELRASNEELQAMNEELRSSAEELETSKEELQSINEELTTVNQELKIKIDELSRTNNDFQNLLNSVDIGVIFLDRSLRVNLFSPAARKIFNLIPNDVGRPLSDITNKLVYNDLHNDADKVLDKLLPVEREVSTKDGHTFMMRIFPYRTSEDRISGVVVTFFDVTDRKRAEDALADDLRNTSILHKLSVRLVSEENIQIIYEDILDAAIAVARADGGTVQILDEARQELKLLATRGLDAEMTEHFSWVRADPNTSCGAALQSGERCFVDFDEEGAPDPDGSLKMHFDAGFRSSQSTPLVTRSGKTIGMFSTHWRRHYRPDECELRHLDLLARQAADLLELRHAEEALRDRERELETIISRTPFLLTRCGRDLHYKYVSRAYAEMLGKSPEEVTGKSMVEIMGEAGFRKILPYIKQVLKGERVEYESTIPLAEVGERILHVVYQPDRDTAGNVVGWIASILDVTDQRRAEDSIRFQAQLLNSVEQSVIATDLKGNVIFWNHFAEEMFGWTADEALGRNIFDLTTPDSGLEHAGEIMDRVRSGQSWEGEFLVKRRDGSVFSAHVVNSPVNDAEGNLVGIIGISIDLEERRKMEEALRRSEERMRLLMESFTDYAIFTTDVNGIVDTWNPGAEKIFGYSAEEAIGKPADIVFTKEDLQRNAPETERATAREKGRASDERWHLRKDGTRFFASGVMVPLFDGGRLLGYAKIARDLTEQKGIAQQLQQSREELEQRVAERTEELRRANRTLRQEIADRKSAQDERVTLLRKIVTTQEDERRRIAREIHDQLGQRLTALRLKIAAVKDLCREQDELCGRVARLEDLAAGLDREVSFLAWELRPAVLDDLGLIAAIDNYVREWSQHYNIKAAFHAGTLRRKRLDPETETNLYRIAQEALNNISKHAKAKQANVLLEMRRKQVVLIVEDDGIGFDTDDHSEPLPTGRGLGLIGMQERAAIIGGTLEIESQPGKGTTVYARVPAKFAKNGGSDGA